LVLIWIFTVIYIFWVFVLNEEYENPFTPLSPMAYQEQLKAIWPEHFFRPTGVACTGNSMVISDSLSFYRAPAAAGDSVDIQPLRGIVSLGKQSPWRSIALVCEETGTNCTDVVVLANDGATVTVHPLEGSMATKFAIYTVGRRIRAEIHAIDIVVGDSATEMCKHVIGKKGWRKDARWALNVLTETWDVVSLCPVYDTEDWSASILEPVRILISLPQSVKAGRGDILGVQVDKHGNVWVSAKNDLVSRTELQLWSSKGELLNSWHLPYGRNWAPGICELGDGDFVFTASQNVTNSAAYPEMWHLKADVPDTALASAQQASSKSSDPSVFV
jgi:hypothetical protein